MIVRTPTPEETMRFHELDAIAFQYPLDRTETNGPDSRSHYWAAYNDSGEMMSKFSVVDYSIQFDGHACKMGGIGGVASLPPYRRQGGIRGCFEMALPDMYKNGYDFSYLYPFSTSYYRKFGYECCVQYLQVSVDLGLLSITDTQGSFRLAEAKHPMTDAIRAVDKEWELHYNMMVMHGEDDYGWTEKFDPAATQEFTYVCFSESGVPKAYTTFRMENQTDGRNLICKRFCFADRAGYMSLMRIFKSLSADHRFVKFVLPSATGMQYLMPEWSLGAASFSLRNAGMVRVVNVQRVLKKARYLGSGKVTLEIHDGQIAENCGCFTVTFADGQSVSVEKTELNADAILEIPTFSALIAGVCSLNEAAPWMSGLRVQRDTPALQQAFYKKPLMIADYF